MHPLEGSCQEAIRPLSTTFEPLLSVVFRLAPPPPTCGCRCVCTSVATVLSWCSRPCKTARRRVTARPCSGSGSRRSTSSRGNAWIRLALRRPPVCRPTMCGSPPERCVQRCERGGGGPPAEGLRSALPGGGSAKRAFVLPIRPELTNRTLSRTESMRLSERYGVEDRQWHPITRRNPNALRPCHALTRYH